MPFFFSTCYRSTYKALYLANALSYYNAVNTFKELLTMDVVLIVNENDTVSVSVSTISPIFISSHDKVYRKSNLCYVEFVLEHSPSVSVCS